VLADLAVYVPALPGADEETADTDWQWRVFVQLVESERDVSSRSTHRR
jgi:hypothetical protein